jgi:hypothetical protein
VNINNCNFTGNAVNGNNGIAGAIGSTGTLSINSSIFTGNAVNGNNGIGGALASDGSVNINGSTFNQNTVIGSGGQGGALGNYGTSTITNSTFNGNNATEGGAIYNYDSLTADNSTFTGNIATDGGALYNYNGGTSVIQYNRLIGNGNIDVYSTGGSVNDTENWWGTNFPGTNPTNAGRVTSNVNTTTWIVLTLSASPTSIPVNGSSTIIADLLHDNTGVSVNGIVPYMGLVIFTTNLGTIGNNNMTNGKATTTLKADTTIGTATVSATIGNGTVTTQVIIN